MLCQYIFLPSGERITVHAFVVLFDDIQEVKVFQVVQEELDRLVVRIVPDAGFNEETKHTIMRGLKRTAGPAMRLELRIEDSIEQTAAGKHRMCVSELGESRLLSRAPGPNAGATTDAVGVPTLAQETGKNR